MRCKNCGWPNKPGETTCSKCGTPLDGSAAPAPSHNTRVNEGTQYAPTPNAEPVRQANTQMPENLKRTVSESAVFGQTPYQAPAPAPATTPAAAPMEATTPCPKCGYPVRPGATKCPNCNFDPKGVAPQPTPAPAPAPAQPERPAAAPQAAQAPKPAAGKFSGTVNPYMMMESEEQNRFTLKPLKRQTERYDLDPIEYTGDEVRLNRDNTEPANASITSRCQAVIVCKDGRWYIKDCSDQHTTFVQAAKPVALHNGDLILLGNRLFEFSE